MLALIVGLTGCSSKSDAQSKTPTVVASRSIIGTATREQGDIQATSDEAAVTLLNKAAKVMKEVQSYHFVWQLESNKASSNSEGDFSAPDRLKITNRTGTSETKVVAIGQECYVQKPGSDTYVIADQPTRFGTGCVAPYQELSKQISAMKSAHIEGDETIDGINTTHINFIYDTAVSLNMEAGMLGESGADVWIDKQTGFIHQQIVYGGSSLSLSIAPVIYSKFNEPIQPPIEKPHK